MSSSHSTRRGMYYGTWREVPGIILGLVLFGIEIGASYYLSLYGLYYLGQGSIVLGILGAAWSGFAYAALNRKRKFDIVLLVVVVGYAVFAYGIEYVLAIGQEIVNIILGSSLGFIVEIFTVILALFLVVAALFYAKRTDLR